MVQLIAKDNALEGESMASRTPGAAAHIDYNDPRYAEAAADILRPA